MSLSYGHDDCYPGSFIIGITPKVTRERMAKNRLSSHGMAMTQSLQVAFGGLQYLLGLREKPQ